jgi:SRSO17 transposase
MRGLLLPGERKSIEPIASRLCPDDVQQLHHFVSVSTWPTAPLETALAREANRLVGGNRAVLIVDDTANVKQGKHSVGVARQYCGELGKRANCQTLVSLTLAQAEVPIPIALRLYLPESWAGDVERRRRAGVPEEVVFRTKGEIALAEIDRVMAAGVRFGYLLADAGYGSGAEFRRALSVRRLKWAVGIQPTQKVYPARVRVRRATSLTGESGASAVPTPTLASYSAAELIASLGERAFRRITWRKGSKRPLTAHFAAVRVRVADGAQMKGGGGRLPGGEDVWLICERRSGGELKYYLSNLPEDTSLRNLTRVIKARWSCEQAHQQLKGELGLDHYEGRSWRGLHHHALLTMMSFCFLQYLRLEGKARGD